MEFVLIVEHQDAGQRLDVPLLGQIPYSEDLMLSIDKGEPLVFSNDQHPISEIFNKIAISLEE